MHVLDKVSFRLLCYFTCCMVKVPGLQVSDTLRTAEELLVDLPGFKSFRHDTLELHDELDAYERDQFDNWCHATLAAIDSKREPLGLGACINSVLSDATVFVL